MIAKVSPFTIEEIEKAAQGIEVNKTPGIDGILPIAIDKSGMDFGNDELAFGNADFS